MQDNQQTENKAFQVGDVVCLNDLTANTRMTVEFVRGFSGVPDVVCVWFDNDLHLHRETFSASALRHA